MLFPFELKRTVCCTPFDRYPTICVAQRTIFDRIGRELMKREAERYDLLIGQWQRVAFDAEAAIIISERADRCLTDASSSVF